jgi:16S rRNA (adenine1518-N6/adenine1519-N6)-dimethyltransferase
MLQKEMVERLLAKPRTHEYNAFSVFIQSVADVKHLMNVSKNCFYPAPEVDSIVIQIQKKDNNIDMKLYDRFLKQCFNSKRKTLVNNLSSSNLKKEEVLNFLNKQLLSSLARAEELTPETFLKLFTL